MKILGFVILVSIALGLSCSTAGALYHRMIMRGTIVDQNGGELILCIGYRDGAAEGQILKVYRHYRERSPSNNSGIEEGFGSRRAPAHTRFRREFIGQVRITAVMDGHFALAVSESGSAAVNDIVEME